MALTKRIYKPIKTNKMKKGQIYLTNFPSKQDTKLKVVSIRDNSVLMYNGLTYNWYNKSNLLNVSKILKK